MMDVQDFWWRPRVVIDVDLVGGVRNSRLGSPGALKFTDDQGGRLRV
ncbi:MAG: hypothetical protein U9N79_06900 [Actinomycetota bacterium]|nr:hypothetical protein [Actinomycetota bacterium]